MTHGYCLKQDVETRFGTQFIVAERFLHAVEQICHDHIVNRRRTANDVFETILTAPSEVQGSRKPYLGIEAVIGEFRTMYDATVLFEMANVPTIHMPFTILRHCIRYLELIEACDFIDRVEGVRVWPSDYSYEVSVFLWQLFLKVKGHEIWLVGCFLYPFFRGLEFWNPECEHKVFLARAETRTIILCECFRLDGTQGSTT